MMQLITEGTREISGAGYTINTDPDELAKAIIEGIEAKRKLLDREPPDRETIRRI
jgi:carbon-monoxide dehydrogenase catalytic subunit